MNELRMGNDTVEAVLVPIRTHNAILLEALRRHYATPFEPCGKILRTEMGVGRREFSFF